MMSTLVVFYLNGLHIQRIEIENRRNNIFIAKTGITLCVYLYGSLLITYIAVRAKKNGSRENYEL